ncbi:MAG: tetratricopeptide repeat-containing sensor histidine kinase [Cytophagales bacterium]|nr:tetratricopeptide repeat-containing sensor histidine kinase [Bernardetiaceae bacterium]MDW8204832.1 tetratricopeptide repeat-containing sensor histidine kinase [Cytophagales bacterium]
MAALLINIANLNRQLGDTSARSVDNLYARAFRVATHLRDTAQLVGMAYSRNHFLLSAKRYTEAHKYLQEALRLSRLANMKIEEANLTNQLGIILGIQNQTKEALQAFQQSIEFYQKAGDSARAIYPLDEMANLLFRQQQYEQAIEKGLQAWEIKSRNENYRFILPRIQTVLAECYLQTGQIEQSRHFAMNLLEEGWQSNRKTTTLAAYRLLYRIDSAIGNIQSEIVWLKKYYQLKDSIMSAEKTKTLEALNANYINKQIKNENLLQAAQLAERNTYLLASSVVLLLTLAFLIVFIRQSAKRRAANLRLTQKNEEISHQNEELAARNRELAALNNEKTNLIRIITHDLRTPLGNISSLAQIALHDERSNREVIGMIEQVAKDALDTVAQLLNWQQLHQTELVVNKSELNVGEMLHTLAERFAPEALRKLINIHLLVPNNGAYVAIGDRNFTRNILENLISNALKFSPHGKNVYLKVATQYNMLAIQVQDEGPGIKPEEMPRLFGQFQQLSARPTGGEPSSGLGLYIAKRYALAMSGDLICESPPNQGATFTLLLPKA